jgi:hypothetical protein
MSRLNDTAQYAVASNAIPLTGQITGTNNLRQHQY